MIRIYTLGDFDIKIRGESILHSIGNNAKLIKLFKYFLTFQGKKLLPDKIIEDIWENEEYEDPLSVLRTQISRVRSIFNLKKYELKPFFEIKYIDGYYVFLLKDNCTIDFLQLEKYLNDFSTLTEKNQTLNCGSEILQLYRGDYLGELVSDHWIIPVRSRYNRLFINSLTKYLDLLNSSGDYNNIVCLCEKIMCQFPYEEIIHLNYIQSLVNLNQIRPALNHYSYYTSKIYTDLNAKPSSKMMSLYKTIREKEENIYSNISLNSLDEELKENDDYKGALVCDSYYFRFLYNFKSRVHERDDLEKAFVGIVTIDKEGYGELSKEELKYNMFILLDLVKFGLRKGDTIAQWNSNQALIMLTGLEEDKLIFLIDRLKKNFKSLAHNDKVILNIKFKEI